MNRNFDRDFRIADHETMIQTFLSAHRHQSEFSQVVIHATNVVFFFLSRHPEWFVVLRGFRCRRTGNDSNSTLFSPRLIIRFILGKLTRARSWYGRNNISTLVFHDPRLVIFNYCCGNTRCAYCISQAKYLYNCRWISYGSRGRRRKKCLLSPRRHERKLLLAVRKTVAFTLWKIRNYRFSPSSQNVINVCAPHESR